MTDPNTIRNYIVCKRRYKNDEKRPVRNVCAVPLLALPEIVARRWNAGSGGNLDSARLQIRRTPRFLELAVKELRMAFCRQ